MIEASLLMVIFIFRFAVHNVPSQSQFNVDIDISVCFEAKVSPCRTVYSVMKTSELLHASCDISNNMMPFKGMMITVYINL
jgi:hypothetical protein